MEPTKTRLMQAFYGFAVRPGGTMRKLWLDDVRPAPDGWTWVKNYDDALAALAPLSPDDSFSVISLDHDLGMTIVSETKDGIVVAKEVEAKTGYDVICWIEEQILNGDMNIPDEIRCHSANPAGKRRIELAIKNIQKLCEANRSAAPHGARCE